jgi:hypothetical protein
MSLLQTEQSSLKDKSLQTARNPSGGWDVFDEADVLYDEDNFGNYTTQDRLVSRPAQSAPPPSNPNQPNVRKRRLDLAQ